MTLKAHRRWIIYLISCLLFTLSQFYRSSIAVISPNLANDLNLDAKDLGFISAAFFYAFAVMQIPVGLYLDSVGPRILMTALSLAAAAGTAMFAYGESATTLIVGRLLLGMGMACNLMGPLKLMTSWYSPQYFATLAALFFSMGTAGNILASTPLVWMTAAFGWRHTFLLFAILNLGIAIVFYSIARDQPEDVNERWTIPASTRRLSSAFSGIGQLFASRDYWLISIGTFFRYGVYASVQALWAGPFLMVTMAVSQLMAGNLLLAMSIGLVVGSPISGWISDSLLHSRKLAIIPGLGAMAGILMTLSLLPGGTAAPVLYLLFFGFGFFSGAGQIMYAHIKERMPLENAGAAMTGINFFTMTGVAVFLHAVGWAIKEFYPRDMLAAEAYPTVFMIFAGCLCAAALLYMFTGDSPTK